MYASRHEWHGMACSLLCSMTWHGVYGGMAWHGMGGMARHAWARCSFGGRHACAQLLCTTGSGTARCCRAKGVPPSLKRSQPPCLTCRLPTCPPALQELYGRVLLGKGPPGDLLYPLYFKAHVGTFVVPSEWGVGCLSGSICPSRVLRKGMWVCVVQE